MSAIAAYRTSILALLADAGKVVFSDNDVDQALRWALSEYSYHRPLIRTYQYSVIGSTATHELPADFVTREIVKVELFNANPDQVIELEQYSDRPDEQWIIHTKNTIANAQVLTVYYSVVHQVDGLDSAAGTTVPTDDEILLELGAAGHAALMRATNRAETINMNPGVVDAYRALALDYTARFSVLLSVQGGPRTGLPDFPGDHPTTLEF